MLSAASFVPTPSYLSIASLNASIVTGDFNHDGRIDFAVTRSSDNTVAVMLNNGDGTFQKSQTIHLLNPSSLVAADFNGDGIVDLVATSGRVQGSKLRGVVDILYGQGNGTFSTPAVIARVRGGFGAMATGDFNGDGLPDVAVTSISSVNIILNAGSGLFATPTRILSGPGNATAVEAADLNGDGIQDLVITNQNKNSISVLQGLSGGALAPFVQYRTGGVPHTVAVADINGDHLPDLVVANGGFRAGISTFMNQGDGTFGTQVKVSAGNFPQGLTIADFNGDGIPDIAATDFFGPLRVFPGNGDGTFGDAAQFFSGANGDNLISADVTGNGKKDLIISRNGNITVLLNTSP